MRRLFVAACLNLLLPVALLAQLVPGATNAPKAKKSAPASSTQKAAGQKAAAQEVDLNDKLGLPKRFEGAVILKKSGQVSLAALGSWGPAPEIQGGSPSAIYSKMAARLSEFMTLKDESGYYLLSFNVGEKNGRLIFRTFQWPQKEEFSYKQAPNAVQDDEGEGTFKNGVIEFETEKYKFIFRATSDEKWIPKNIRLVRWTASDVKSESQLRSVNREAYPGQYVPTWAGGSYLCVDDGFLEKIYFKYFAGNVTFAVPAVNLGESKAFGYTSLIKGQELVNKGCERLSEWWAEGLRGFGQDTFEADAKTGLKFSKDGKLQMIGQVGGESSINVSYSSILEVNTEDVPLDAAVRDELLDRLKDQNWPLAAGPYGLSRTLLRAFKNCRLIVPKMVVNTSDSMRRQSFNRQTMEGWVPAHALWKELAESAGAELISERGNDVYKNPLGQILSPGVSMPEKKVAYDSSEPQRAVNEAGLSKAPTSDGFYLYLKGKWAALPSVSANVSSTTMTIGSNRFTNKYGRIKFGPNIPVVEIEKSEKIKILIINKNIMSSGGVVVGKLKTKKDGIRMADFNVSGEIYNHEKIEFESGNIAASVTASENVNDGMNVMIVGKTDLGSYAILDVAGRNAAEFKIVP